MDVSNLIADIYDAGTGRQSWHEVGKGLFTHLHADSGSLRVADGTGASVNVFDIGTVSHHNRHDPIQTALATLNSGQHESHQILAHGDGQDHLLVGVVEDCGTAIGLFRRGEAFSDDDRALLARLLPHLQRAIQLGKRLNKAERVAELGSAAFDALPGTAFMVDEDLNILATNHAADQVLGNRNWPVSAMRKPTPGQLSSHLVILDRHKHARLKSMVRNAARGGIGGAFRLEIEDAADGRPGHIAVLVSPHPEGSVAWSAARPDTSAVLVIMRELSRPEIPRPSLLSDLFGLSIAEGAVAQALMGGKTAECVAQERDVSLDTIRSQIRTVLRKTEASNLRDLGRIGAMLSTMGS